MNRHYITSGNIVKEMLAQDYTSILDSASDELSDAEYRHLVDIANVGYEHAWQKDDYVDSLRDTVCEWVSETRRAKLHLTQCSTDIDFEIWYNDASEVREKMREHQHLSVIPSFFVYFGAVTLALFCVFATIFVTGICQESFPMNPVYLFMFTVGFFGLLLTDIVAIAEWRKDRDGT